MVVILESRREAQLVIDSAVKARAGDGDYGHKRSTKRANVSTDGGQGNEGPRRSSRHSDKEAGDDSRSHDKTSTNAIERGTTEEKNKGKDGSGAKGGTKRGSTSDEAPARYPKRARKL